MAPASDTRHIFSSDSDELRRRLAAALEPVPSSRIFDNRLEAPRSDFELNPTMRDELKHIPIRPAAVLVGIVLRAEEPTVLLTQRNEQLPTHSGQISFPGGKVDACDATPTDTALRETEEEIGLDRRHIEIVGFLDTYQTGTGFRIMPAVGLLRPPFALNVNVREVKDAFEVPLSFLMDASNHQRKSGEWRGRIRHFYAMPYRERYIWGATAGIIRNLHERLIG
ncbi:MAG: CoA pyrophosphatase [Hyphomicrobiaceae bacterium]|nr:MAG: CoA pyrophosphatase [Hyphomicrobiaceae bacterium]